MKKFNFFIQQSTIYNLKFTILGFLCSLFIAGCGKQTESDQIRRAQLVGAENVQLKKDIAAKDKQIADLSGQLEQSKAELAKQIEQLKTDNEGLKKKYVELQQNHDKTASEFQASLAACAEQLDAKPTPCEEVEEKYAKLHGDLLNLLSECATKLEKYEGAADSNQLPAKPELIIEN